MVLDNVICGDLSAASKREWLETNGIGGYASSTVTGLNTRRYHGLLVAATKPPVGRMVLLSKLEETLIVDGDRYDLSSNQYAGAVHPQGFQLQQEFRLDPSPVWTYEAGGVRVVKSLFLVHGENTVVVEYSISRPVDDCELEVRPLVAFRDFHATTHANAGLDRSVGVSEGMVSFAPYEGLPSLYFAHNARAVHEQGDWYYGFQYEAERERGLDFQEDLFQPFTLRFSGTANAIVIASTRPHSSNETSLLRKRELARHREVASKLPCEEPLVAKLAAAADQFIVERGDLKSVVAGYHWFGDWGRDTMIALPGLTLSTGRPAVARSILLAFARCVDQGMLPNRFPDDGEAPEYNTVDATLWFFEATRAYVEYTGDFELVERELYRVLKDILDWHIRGTRFGIRADADGLLLAGKPGVQLTWMDAKVGDWVVTPRHGKPVEIQALWYNALRTLEAFAETLGDESSGRFTHEFASMSQSSFNQRFWNADTGCLFDCISGEGSDGAIRPNQVFAASLHYPILDMAKFRPMLEVVERELLTPFGLRTLSPQDASYRPRYEGGVMNRDSAYHQGTVWPWLLGPFITAYVKADGRSRRSRRRAQEWLERISENLQSAGLGQFSEILDAEAPHTPRGCIAQAWSVAELLRAAVEDVFEVAPAKARSRAA